MAVVVGSVVAPRIAIGSPSAQQSQPPRWGIAFVVAAGPPILIDILWEDGLRSQAQADNETDLHLDIIEDATQANVDLFQGTMALRKGPGAPFVGPTGLVVDAAGGTSREFAGRVVSVHKRTPSQSQAGSGQDFVLIQASPNLYYEDLASQFVVLTNR
jgi:hypothetical protein